MCACVCVRVCICVCVSVCVCVSLPCRKPHLDKSMEKSQPKHQLLERVRLVVGLKKACLIDQRLHAVRSSHVGT